MDFPGLEQPTPAGIKSVARKGEREGARTGCSGGGEVLSYLKKGTFFIFLSI
jgi:hypothetical protein